MRPLLALRRISPLQALRRNTDNAALPRQWNDPLRIVVDLLLVDQYRCHHYAIRMGNFRDRCLWVSRGDCRSRNVVLYIAASVLIEVARRNAFVRPSWAFALRQGIANLHRPANQTRAVTLALGFWCVPAQHRISRAVESVETHSAYRVRHRRAICCSTTCRTIRRRPLDSLDQSRNGHFRNRAANGNHHHAYAVNQRAHYAAIAKLTPRCRARWAGRCDVNIARPTAIHVDDIGET